MPQRWIARASPWPSLSPSSLLMTNPLSSPQTQACRWVHPWAYLISGLGKGLESLTYSSAALRLSFYPLYPRWPQSGKVNSSSKQCTDLNTSVINSESPVKHWCCLKERELQSASLLGYFSQGWAQIWVLYFSSIFCHALSVVWSESVPAECRLINLSLSLCLCPSVCTCVCLTGEIFSATFK